MLKQKTAGLKKQCICFKAEGKALPRQGYFIYDDKGTKVGQVASGSQGIFVGYPIAMGFVPPAFAKLGNKLFVEIRDSKVAAEVVPRPFYKRKG